MRLHIELEDGLVSEIDAAAGPRGRSGFIREAIEVALRQRKQRELVRSTRGSINPQGHEWEPDLARWVRRQRRADARKVG